MTFRVAIYSYNNSSDNKWNDSKKIMKSKWIDRK